MPPVSIPIPPRFRSRSRGSRAHSRSSSVDSLASVDAPPARQIQRWNGITREATDWNALRRDPELYFPRGNCLIYLYTQGASRRGPSFRVPYDFLLYSACRPLIEQALLTSRQSSVYHPGSNTPPSYENIHDADATDHTYLSLYLDAPPHLGRQDTFTYHVTTRNFVAWLVGVPLVGTDPVSALIDLKGRMDIWRDVGADNFAALEQYVQEQAYGDFEEMESEMERRLNDPNAHTSVQPYRNLGDIEIQPVPSLEMDEQDMKRGRRNSFTSSLRSTSSRIRRKFSRTRREEDDDDGVFRPRSQMSPTPPDPIRPGSRIPRSATATPIPTGPRSPATAVPETHSAKQKAERQVNGRVGTPNGAGRKLKKSSSFRQSLKRHLSWLAGPMKPLEDPEPVAAPPGTGPPGAPGKGVGGPPGGGPQGFAFPTTPNPLPYRQSFDTKTFATEANLSMHSSGVQPLPPQQNGSQSALPLGTFRNYSRPDLGRSMHGSAAGSQSSLHGMYVDGQGMVRCECCGKLARKPSVQKMAPASGPKAGSSYGAAAAGPSDTHSRKGSIRDSVLARSSSFISAATHAPPQDISQPRGQVAENTSVVGPTPALVRHISSAARVPSMEPVPQPTIRAQAKVPPSPQKQETNRNYIREMYAPNYGDGHRRQSSQQNNHGNGKGKDREVQKLPVSPIQTQVIGYETRPRGPETRDSISSSDSTGLPELDFAGNSPPSLPSPVSIVSPEAVSFRSTHQVSSRPQSRGPSLASMDMMRSYQPSSTIAYQQEQNQRSDSAAGSLQGGKQSSIHELVTKSSPHSGNIRRDELGSEYRRRESLEDLMHDLKVTGMSSPSETTYGGSAGVAHGRAGDLSRSRDGRDEDELVGVGGMRTLGLKA